MSTPSALQIESQLTQYDIHVRQAIEQGTIEDFMHGKAAEIKTFYKSCMHVTGAAATSFDAPRYLNHFLHDWRHNKDTIEYFLRRQQLKLREWDVKYPCSVPMAPAAPLTPQAGRFNAVAGPGPTTAASRAVRFSGRSTATPAAPSTATVSMEAIVPKRTFAALDRDSDSDEERAGKGKGKKAGPPGTAPRAKELSGEDGDDEDAEYDQVEETSRKIIVSRPRARKATTTTTNTAITKGQGRRQRPLPVATGELHNPPCQQCVHLKRACEKEINGRACVSCKAKKHRCDYSIPNVRRHVKSRAEVESGDEGAAGLSANGPVREPEPVGTRPQRTAGKRAKEAIQLDAAMAPKPPRRGVKKMTPASAGLPDDIEDKMVGLEQRLTGLQGTVGGVMTVLEQASLGQRLERCESEVDRLSNLVDALCRHVGFSVSGRRTAQELDVPAEAPAFRDSTMDPLDGCPAASHESTDMPPPAATELSIVQPSAQPTAAAEDPSNAPPPIVNLISATPQNSQEAANLQNLLDQHPPAGQSLDPAIFDPIDPAEPAVPNSAPPSAPATSDALAALNNDEASAALDVPAAPAAAQSPRRPRSRTATPLPPGPDTLEVPGRITRSKSRSPSPSPVLETSGKKRKADEGSDDGSDQKKQRV